MRKTLLIILAAGLIGLAGCRTTGTSGEVEKFPNTREKAPQGGFAQVEKALRQGDSSEALETLEEYKDENPEDLDGQVLYATLLMSQGDIESSRNILEEVLSIDSAHQEALFNLAFLEGFAGNRDRQLELLEGLRDINPDNGDIHAALGDFYLAGEEKEMAKAAFVRSLELDTENIAALSGLGNILLMEKDYAGAEAKLLRAVALYPEDPFVHTDLSRARIAQEQYSLAREDLNQAVELAPDNYWIRMDRAKLLLNKLLNANDALKDFDEAVRINPDYFYAYIFRAGIYDEKGRRKEAIEDYRKLLELRPDYYFAYRSLATLLYMEESWDQAREIFEKAFEYEPDWGFKLLAGLTYYRDDREKEGQAYLQEFLDTIPREDHFYALTRMCIDPGYQVFTLQGIREEKDRFVQTRMMFYLGAVLQAHGGDAGAGEQYFQVRDRNLLGMFERRMAVKELESFGETGD